MESNTNKEQITASELASLWVVYQKKTMMVRVTEFLLSKNQDPEYRKILQTFHKGEKNFVDELVTIFKHEGAVVPVGFTEKDVNHEVPRLFDDTFAVMYLRTMMKIATGIHAIHMTMAYRKDIMDLYKKFTEFAEEILVKATQCLLRKGALPKPPYVTLPHHVAFTEEKAYRSGFKLGGHRRSLNTVEVAYLYQGIESNVIGMKLMTGFAQVAREEEIAKYFFRGKELAKAIISKFSESLLDSDVNVPAPSAGLVTDSTMSPFSDKLMLYNTSLLSDFALGSNALGTSFSLRKDLSMKMLVIGKDIMKFANEGGNLTMKYGWMEEPPQMEDRIQLTKRKSK